jgi:hypothetical protein
VRLVGVVVMLAACQQGAARDASIALAPIHDAAASPAITRLSVHDGDIVCLHAATSAHCLRLSGGSDPTGKTFVQVPVPEPAAKPNGVTGFMAGCALALDGTVSGWTDPNKPRKVAMPAHVAEILLVDLFTLCARTDDGAVYCAPKFVPPGSFACSDAACGSGGIEGPITHTFDPIALLARPLQPMHLPEAARSLVGDDGRLFTATIENTVPGSALGFGGCALGSSGAVACFVTCERGWGMFRVTGLPAIAELSPDWADGFALATDGSVWTWPHACSGAVAAARVDLPPVAQLAKPLGIRVGPSGGQVPTRCVLTRSGEVSCWTRARADRPSVHFDVR